ncbi:MAG: dipeptidase [Candidatus Heimdallarchaeota archaeon]
MTTLTPEQEARAGALHKQATVIDGHSDFPIEVDRCRARGETAVLKNRHLPNLVQGGVDVEVLAVWCDSYLDILNTPLKVLKVMDDLHQELQESEKFHLIKTYDDIIHAKNAGKIGLLLQLEGTRPIRENLFLLRTYYQLGLRQVGLTWNQRNLVADGCGEEHAGGLSNFGRHLVEEMNRLNMILDVSHVSERSFWDAIEIIKSPPVASHSNTRAVCDFPRNLSDAQIEALADRGGVMGICFHRSLVGDPPTLETLLNHIDHIVDLVGIDHIALGPDFIDYIMDKMIEEDNRLKEHGIDYGSHEYVNELQTVTQLTNFTRALVARGYEDEAVKKILGGNLLRIYQKILR